MHPSSPADALIRSQTASNAGTMNSKSLMSNEVALANLQHSTIARALKSCSRSACRRPASEGAFSVGMVRDPFVSCFGLREARCSFFDLRFCLVAGLRERLGAFEANLFLAMSLSSVRRSLAAPSETLAFALVCSANNRHRLPRSSNYLRRL